jgi:hypothetical protein
MLLPKTGAHSSTYDFDEPVKIVFLSGKPYKKNMSGKFPENLECKVHISTFN